MPPRLSAQQRKKEIINAAVELFSKQGFTATTTKQVAEAAGITEALIYRHFTSKEELYQEALQHLINKLKKTTFFKTVFSGKSPKNMLPVAATENIKFMDNNPQFIRMLLFCGLQNHQLATPFFQSVALPFLEMMENFISSGQVLGTVRHDINPRMSAMQLIGSIVFFNITRNIFQIRQFREIEPEEYVNNLTLQFFSGIAKSKEESDA